MCGIMGFSRYNKVAARMAPHLAWEMANRGMDSWGMTNGQEVLRFSGPQIVNYQTPPEHWRDGIVAWHNRGASFRDNASDPNCAHPYTFTKPDGSTVIGLHNGVVKNHKELNTKYNRQFPVDSMHLFAHLAEDKSWGELHGWGNIVWFDTLPTGERKVHFIRINSGDFHIVTYEDGTLGWCSVFEPLKWVGLMYNNPIKTLWRMDEYQPYSFREENGHAVLVESGKPIKFPLSMPTMVTSLADIVLPNRYIVATPNAKPPMYCKICYQKTIDPKVELFCTDCLLTKISAWLLDSMVKEHQNEKHVISSENTSLSSMDSPWRN